MMLKSKYRKVNLVLGVGQFPFAVLSKAFNHLELFAGVKRRDLEETLIDDRHVELLVADDAANVVVKVTHRQLISGVGRHHDMHVCWPRFRQPRQTLSGHGRKVVQTVQQNNQSPLCRQSIGNFMQCRHEVLAQIAVFVHIFWQVNTVYLRNLQDTLNLDQTSNYRSLPDNSQCMRLQITTERSNCLLQGLVT